jgi:hypothetical protein
MTAPTSKPKSLRADRCSSPVRRAPPSGKHTAPGSDGSVNPTETRWWTNGDGQNSPHNRHEVVRRSRRHPPMSTANTRRVRRRRSTSPDARWAARLAHRCSDLPGEQLADARIVEVVTYPLRRPVEDDTLPAPLRLAGNGHEHAQRLFIECMTCEQSNSMCAWSQWVMPEAISMNRRRASTSRPTERDHRIHHHKARSPGGVRSRSPLLEAMVRAALPCRASPHDPGHVRRHSAALGGLLGRLRRTFPRSNLRGRLLRHRLLGRLLRSFEVPCPCRACLHEILGEFGARLR